LDYQERVIFTRGAWSLTDTHGLLTGSQNESFTFSWWHGTEKVERTYYADRYFFTFPAQGTSDYAIQANYVITTTDNGYFEVNFLSPPDGVYGIGSSVRYIDRIVEFVSP